MISAGIAPLYPFVTQPIFKRVGESSGSFSSKLVEKKRFLNVGLTVPLFCSKSVHFSEMKKSDVKKGAVSIFETTPSFFM